MAWIERTHWFSFPKFRGENKQTFELPPPSLTFPFVYFKGVLTLLVLVHLRECKHQKSDQKGRGTVEPWETSNTEVRNPLEYRRRKDNLAICGTKSNG